MNSIQSIFKNSSWLLASQLSTSILGYLWIILIARYLGVGEFGIVNFSISFAGIISIAMDFGISIYTVRTLSRKPQITSRFLGVTIPLKIILSTCAMMVSFLILLIMNSDALTIEVCLIIVLQNAFIGMVNLFNGVFQAHEKMKYQAIGTIINSLFLLLGVLVSIYFNLGIVGVVISYLVASIISVVYGFIKANRKIVSPKFEINTKYWKKIIILSSSFGLTAIFTSIYSLIDSVMLFNMIGNDAVGLYSAAFKIVAVFLTIYGVYSSVVFPFMSKFFKDSKTQLKISYRKSIKYLLLLIFPVAIALQFYSSPIISLIYGNSYEESATILNILIWSVVFIFINGSSTALLNSSFLEKNVLKINVFACMVNVILNLILIPKYSSIGASFATIVTGVVIAILMNSLINKSVFKLEISILKDILKIIASSLILGIILYFAHLPLILAIPVGIIVYFGAIFLTKTFDHEDIYIIKEIFGKNK
ncbi:flippase [Methanobrevibacter curvatus]|uniref:Lipopolysaccharide biosynthesis protein WzxC n=1 Tax=Methanobrevibacter curvatus TaxID=49547 RepID=A0A166AX53_9EURY|nr:flippase [Methanobrevibacter curvatus]KZX12582.1 lipopolysaccharide biosynthesis protein WzxC [Methanobrevibacter curvatus]